MSHAFRRMHNCFRARLFGRALGSRPLEKFTTSSATHHEVADNVEQYADFLEERVNDLDQYVIVGNSFGALIATSFAVRRHDGLVGIVLSGGFAVRPIADNFLKTRIRSAQMLPGPLYRSVTLKAHARELASPFDAYAEVPWSDEATRKMYENNTPHRTYIDRMKAALHTNYMDLLPIITAPTLVVVPSYDTLFGRDAARKLVHTIPNAEGVVLRRTGPMLRFTHPYTFSKVIDRFIEESVDQCSYRTRVGSERPSGYDRHMARRLNDRLDHLPSPAVSKGALRCYL